MSAAPTAEARREAPRPAESAQAPVAETKETAITAMSADERFALARAQLPELDELLRQTSKPDFSRFGAEGATVALWVPESVLSHGADTSKRCRRVVFEVHPDRLRAEVPTNGGEGRPRLKAPASFEEIELRQNVVTYALASRSLERNANGELIEANGGIGGFENHGGDLLEIRDDAIAYGVAPVGAQAVCASFEDRPCVQEDGTKRACVRCTKLAVRLVSQGARHGFHRVKAGHVGIAVPEGEALPACSACPADALSQEIPRLDQALAGMTFYRLLDSEPWPVISKKKATCEAAERAHSP
ncbi:hypothetical protein [Polyangium aurulentum]|uniref:hypothetical protein n=1 Tax=Polyangium aurulentum TaxID=2567896 RepID=UPI0010AE0183|nr:hypothetical protein [Polyangium aurulentum]UQA60943.1 hypothetical protein E8A73_010865 [Polyangium aurulentum]